MCLCLGCKAKFDGEDDMGGEFLCWELRLNLFFVFGLISSVLCILISFGNPGGFWEVLDVLSFGSYMIISSA